MFELLYKIIKLSKVNNKIFNIIFKKINLNIIKVSYKNYIYK